MKLSRNVWIIGASLVILFAISWSLAARYWPTETITPGSSPSAQLADLPTPSTVASTPTVASPSPTTQSSPNPKASVVASPAVSSSDTKVTLQVPFTIQAPDGDWSEPWQEGCEEAALLMVQAYLKGDRSEVMPVAETKAAIKKMVDWQIGRIGSHRDIGVVEMAMVAEEYLNLKPTIHRDQSIEDIKNALRAGRPVIIPAAGRSLGNPYFTQPGPPYHVFVITGFDGNTFISNENGTRRGHDYQYSTEAIERAWHDLNSNDEAIGPRDFLTLDL